MSKNHQNVEKFAKYRQKRRKKTVKIPTKNKKEP